MSLITTGAIVASLCGAQIGAQSQNSNQSNLVSCLELKYTSKRTNLISSRNGYVDYQYKVYSAKFTEKSKLVCLNDDFSFVPGTVIKKNNPELSNDYNDVRLQGGYMHLKVRTWENEIDPILTLRSGAINYIESYPNKSTKLLTTVSSAFGINLELETTAKGNLAEDGFKVEFESNNRINITCQNSIETLGDDPRVSFQHHKSDKDVAQRSFNAKNPSDTGLQSFNFDTFHFFEIDNYSVDLDCQYMFEAKLDVMMDTKYKIFEADPEYYSTFFTGRA